MALEINGPMLALWKQSSRWILLTYASIRQFDCRQEMQKLRVHYMINPETNLQNRIRLALSNMGIINWRNNTGMGWAGKVLKGPRHAHLGEKDILIRNARPLHAGLCKGSSDVIGIKPTVITEDMVGQTVGIFYACEVKQPKGRVTDDQKIFAEVINSVGGVARIVIGTQIHPVVVVAGNVERVLTGGAGHAR